MVAGALFIALTANVVDPGPGSPVPITGQTFGVLLVGGALGSDAACCATLLYLVAGLVPAGLRRAHAGDRQIIGSIRDGHLVLGATGGYLIGFVLAGALVGRLAELGWDRRIGGALAAMLRRQRRDLRRRRALADGGDRARRRRTRSPTA